MDKKEMKAEILAPVGSYEAFIAAINSGADALYLGGKFFGARAYANNFELEQLKVMIQQAHLRGVRVYYTMNTIIKDVEIKKLRRELEQLSRIYIDAFIIQDMGVYQIIKEEFPHLIVHSSTQMNLHNIYDVQRMKELGYERVVLAREVSIADIKQIKESVDIEVETFVHGALCYSYSGQCLMSSIYGKRSGNRGRCAQPCRMPYTFDGQEAYMISPKDQMTLDILPQLIKAGIDSFKIEGRMKSAEYVGFTTYLYRHYRDLAYELIKKGKEREYQVLGDDVLKLKQLYNRGEFTDGYYSRHNGSEMISLTHGKHYGVQVGKGSKTKQGFILNFDQKVKKGDLLEFQAMNSLVKDSNTLTFTLEKDSDRGRVVVPFIYDDKQLRVQPNDYSLNTFSIRRLKSVQLIEELNIQKKELMKLQIDGRFEGRIGEGCVLEISLETKEGIISCKVTGSILQQASNKPVTKETLLKQLCKTGESQYTFRHIDFSVDDNIFIPMSSINQLRRDGIQRLTELVLQRYNDERDFASNSVENLCLKFNTIEKKEFEQNKKDGSSFSVMLRNDEHIKGLCQYKNQGDIQVVRAYIDINDLSVQRINKAIEEIQQSFVDDNIEIILALPHVILESRVAAITKKLCDIDSDKYEGYLLRSIGQQHLINQLKCHGLESNEVTVPKKIVYDYNLNIFNKKSVQFYKELGAESMHLSLELNEAGLKEIMNRYRYDGEFMVYGAYPLMHSSNCIYKTMKGCRKISEGHEFVINDRKGQSLTVNAHCDVCYNTIYNGKKTYLLDVCQHTKGLKRIEFTNELAKDVVSVLRQIRGSFDPEYFTRGHYKRGVK